MARSKKNSVDEENEAYVSTDPQYQHHAYVTTEPFLGDDEDEEGSILDRQRKLEERAKGVGFLGYDPVSSEPGEGDPEDDSEDDSGGEAEDDSSETSTEGGTQSPV